jgi:hypothetical protein
LPTLNPIHLMFSIDNAQNRYFKRVVLYNKVKRQAFKDMAAHGDVAFRLQGQIAHLLTLGPKARIEAIMHDPAVAREARAGGRRRARQLRPLHREGAATFKRYVLFYGFMRYSLRTLLYTLPVKHPITVGGREARAAPQPGGEGPARQERAAVGVRVDLPGHEGRQEGADGVHRPGRPSGRKAPDDRAVAPEPGHEPAGRFGDGGPKAFGSFISPVLQIALNQMYGRNLFTPGITSRARRGGGGR